MGHGPGVQESWVCGTWISGGFGATVAGLEGGRLAEEGHGVQVTLRMPQEAPHRVACGGGFHAGPQRTRSHLLRGWSSVKCYPRLSPASPHHFIALPPPFLGGLSPAPILWVPAPEIQCLLCGFPLPILQVSCFPAGLSSNIPNSGVLPVPWGSHSLQLSFPGVSGSLPQALALVVGQSCVGPPGLTMVGGGELEPHLSSRLISEHLFTNAWCLLPSQSGECQYLAEKGMWKPRGSEGRGGSSAEIHYGIGAVAPLCLRTFECAVSAC